MARQSTRDELAQLYDTLVPVLSRAAVGHFDRDIVIDPRNPERVNELLMGVQVLLEVIREKSDELDLLKAKHGRAQPASFNLLDEVLKRPPE
jgi:hypothetical protein